MFYSKFFLSCSLLLSINGFAAEGDMTPGKARVISQLQGLLSSSPIAKMSIKAKQKEKAYLQIIKGADGNSSLIYRSQNVQSRSLVDILENISSRAGRVEECKDENLIFFYDNDKKIEEARKVLGALDILTPQILVEAKVIEVYTNDKKEKEFSFDYNKGKVLDTTKQHDGTVKFPVSGSQPTVIDVSPFTNGISGSIDKFHFFLNWLTTTNDAQILSSPNLTVSLGSTASIVTGDDLPIQSTSTTGSTVNTDVKYRRTGIQLFVTPIRINKTSVKLQVNPEVSTVTKYESLGETKVPVISVRNVKTELTVNDGEIIMLGGLYSSETLNTIKKVPYLSDIPILGWFFTSTSDTTVLKQLIFFLKVTILNGEKSSLVDVEHNAETIEKSGKLLEQSTIFHSKESKKKEAEKAGDLNEKK
ncbi:MAG: type II and III secretion system protein [Lentisphaeria bacterium]|nr:type II and III secretion system protein [Lentisphaeria bacterium]